MNVYEKVNFYRLRLARKNEKKNFFLPFKTCSKHKRSNWKKKKKPLINFSDIESRHQYRDSIFSRKDVVLDPRKQPSNLPSAAPSSSKRIIYTYNTCNEFPVQWNSPVKCGWVGINGSRENCDSSLRAFVPRDLLFIAYRTNEACPANIRGRDPSSAMLFSTIVRVYSVLLSYRRIIIAGPSKTGSRRVIALGGGLLFAGLDVWRPFVES